jgi:IclR family acetate operon transcriptional repressor
MSVKPSQSGARVLAALEQIARHQPLGVSELARLLETNVAAAQRAIATLAEEGWIRIAPGRPTRWELTAHIHAVAQHAYGSHDLRRRARAALEALWRETGESVLLNVPDGGKFIVIDVLESPHYLRTAPPVGLVVPARNSATARAMLPYMSREQQMEFLSEAPDPAMLEDFAAIVGRGYSISKGDVVAGSTNVAAPIFERDGRPVGAVLISAPTDRASEQECERLGAMVCATARRLSRASPPHVEFADRDLALS